MIFSQNIQISADFSNSNNVNLHNKKLEIASLNLDDYNSKLDNHVCKLLYNVGTCEFETLVKNDSHTDFIHSQINYFVYWDSQGDDLTERYLKNTANTYYDPVRSIATSLSITKTPTNENLAFFIKKRNLFFLRFKDSFPLGFLSVEEENKIKTEANRLCKELEDLTKNLYHN